MKKTITLLLLGTSLLSNAQNLEFDFETMTLGDISSDMGGSVPGQQNWYANASNAFNGSPPGTTTNMGFQTFQIIENGDGSHGKALQFTGPNGDTGYGLLLQGTNIDWNSWWNNRPAGNDIFIIEFDYYTGTAGPSRNDLQFTLYNFDFTQSIAGIYIDTNTLAVRGLAWSDDPVLGLNNYLYTLGEQANTDIILPENTWVRLGVSYNYATGEIRFIGSDFYAGVQGSAAGTVPGETGLLCRPSSNNNSAASVSQFDNIVFRNSSENDMLGRKADEIANFVIYPNPVSNVINISNPENIALKGVDITDINGRIVKSVKADGIKESQINVSDLTPGMYIMNVASEKGTMTKKIVKN